MLETKAPIKSLDGKQTQSLPNLYYLLVPSVELCFSFAQNEQQMCLQPDKHLC